jgi:GNAT superfamily N-acetyltransferase
MSGERIISVGATAKSAAINEILRLRHAVTPEDAGSVRRIVESTGFFSVEEVEMAVSLVRERLDRGEASGYFFLFGEASPCQGGPVAYGGGPVAYSCYGPISCTRSSYDLYWIAVQQEHRGKGIGTRLLAATEERIRALGGEKVYAETSSKESYGSSRAFYEKHGYTQEALLRDFYSPGDSKLIYVKEMS